MYNMKLRLSKQASMWLVTSSTTTSISLIKEASLLLFILFLQIIAATNTS